MRCFVGPLAVCSMLVLAGTAACSGDDGAGKAAAARDQLATIVSIVLVDPGAEPRSPLRLAPVVGSTSRSTLSADIDLSGTIDGRPAPEIPIPRFEMDVEVEVTDVGPDGTFAADIAYRDARVVGPPGTSDPLEDFPDVQGGFRVTDRAQIVGRDIRYPEDVEPEQRERLRSIAEQLETLLPPLPAEPVGPGAKWEVTANGEFNGARTETVYEYFLRERDGNRYILDLRYPQRAAPQDVTLPNGTSARLTSFEAFGAGSIYGDLTALLPAWSTTKAQGTTTFVVDDGGTTTEYVQDLSVLAEIGSAEAAVSYLAPP